MNGIRPIVRRQLIGFALASMVAGASLGSAETIHFLIAERPGEAVHGDSYILPLSDPADISQARALIGAEPGTLPSIAVAQISAGADGINRDHLAPGAPSWSWHVTQFEDFSDFTAEILDGWPTFVEQDVDGWIANTGGTIGFWSYTVVAELPAVPEPSTAWLWTLSSLGVLVIPRRRPRVNACSATGAWR